MSKAAITIRDISAMPGTAVRGYVPVGSSPLGPAYSIPLIIVNGAHDGPVLCVDAGVHGDEHEGVMSVLHFANTLDPGSLRGAVLVVPAVNSAALSANQRGIPEDHLLFDPNRVYPGKAEGCITERIAYVFLNEIVKRVDYSVSLHSGASYVYWVPQVLSHDHEASLNLAKGLGPKFNMIARKQPFVGTATEAIVKAGVPSVTIEAGGGGARRPDLFEPIVQVISEGLSNLLVHLGMVEGQPSYPERWQLVEQQPIRSPKGGLLVIEEGVELGKEVTTGQPLFRIVDLLGQEMEMVKAPISGTLTHVRTWPSVHTGHSLGYIARHIETLPLRMEK